MGSFLLVIMSVRRHASVAELEFVRHLVPRLPPCSAPSRDSEHWFPFVSAMITAFRGRSLRSRGLLLHSGVRPAWSAVSSFWILAPAPARFPGPRVGQFLMDLHACRSPCFHLRLSLAVYRAHRIFALFGCAVSATLFVWAAHFASLLTPPPPMPNHVLQRTAESGGGAGSVVASLFSPASCR